MSDYVSHYDQELAAIKASRPKDPERSFVLYERECDKLKATETATVQQWAIELREQTLNNVRRADEMVRELRAEAAQVTAEVTAGRLSAKQGKQKVDAIRVRVERLQAASRGYASAMVAQEQQFAEPLRYADALFKRYPALHANRASVLDVDSRFYGG